MATYAIGDVQGCYEQLVQLLDLINIDPATDSVWFVGDLVSRGPASLEVLRLVRSMGDTATVVLGNHDLHLLALAAGDNKPGGNKELEPILAAPDGATLINWLRHRPLAHYSPNLNTLMVHAGVIPEWNPLQIIKLAREVESVLRGPSSGEFLAAMYGDGPARWASHLQGFDRLRFITNCLTRSRYCRPNSSLELQHKESPGGQPHGLIPWFDMPDRQTGSVRIVFGHWSTLGLYQQSHLLGLDTGCVWGGTLTAARLDGPTRIFSVPG